MFTAVPGTSTRQPAADGWLDGVERRLPSCSAEDAALATDVVLEALAGSLPRALIGTVDEALRPEMRLRFLRAANTARLLGIEPEDSLVGAVAAGLPPDFPFHACLATRTVLAVIAEHVPASIAQRLVNAGPQHWRRLWPASVSKATAI